MDPQLRKRIRKTLADRFAKAEVILMVAVDAGLPRERLPQNGTPEILWSAIIDEADRQGPEVLFRLLSEAVERYPADSELRALAHQVGPAPGTPDPGARPVSGGGGAGAEKPHPAATTAAPIAAAPVAGAPSPGRHFDFFCSYSSTDRARVRLVVEALKRRGVSVFLDHEQIRPGDRGIDVLERGLESSRAGLLFLSQKSLSSGWVREEYHYFINCRARHPRFRIVPILFEDCNLPPFLQQTQCVDCRELVAGVPISAGLEAQLDRLAAAALEARDAWP